MKRTAVMSLVFAAMFMLNGCANASFTKRSDYDPQTFSHLLSDQVWVFKMKSRGDGSGDEIIRADYFSPDGRMQGCWLYKDKHVEDPGFWMLRSEEDYLTLLGMGYNKTFDTTTKKGWVPLFYDPKTGRFHNKTWQGGRWYVARNGWVQSTWPRSMKDACPGLELPEHLQINEKQTSLIMDEVRAQDPAAPIKNFGGHTPAPVITPPVSGTSHDQLISILGPNQTNIWKSEDGGLFAVNLKDHREGQLWS
ncbi:MAG: hypothetical protein GY832_10360, partial [Chloroflexi bacterium]|nr:hypothetical protein [Chloroflexota bacterium]